MNMRIFRVIYQASHAMMEYIVAACRCVGGQLALLYKPASGTFAMALYRFSIKPLHAIINPEVEPGHFILSTLN